MNIIEKFLDLLKLESTREMERAKKDFPNDFVCDRQAVDQANPDFQENFSNKSNALTLLSIKKFWKTHEQNYINRMYRRASANEIEEYAKADVISCFEKPRNNESLSDFRLSQIGITNWYRFFDKLFYSGYLREATAKEVLSSYTLKELKTIAESIAVKKTGKKAELIERICASLSQEELNEIVQEENLFTISEKGREYLTYHSDLAQLRSHAVFDVSLAEFNDKRYIGGRKRNFYDTMFQVLSEQKNFYQINNNYDSMSVVCNRIYDIMLEEFERTEHHVPVDIMLLNYMEALYLAICFSWEVRNLKNGITCDIHCISLPTIKTSLAKFSDYKSLINLNYSRLCHECG